MASTPLIGRRANEGMSESEIEELEKEVGRKFPQAYREFLFLGGKIANMLADLDHSMSDGNGVYIQDNAATQLAMSNITLQSDYWAIGGLDVCEQFTFFYFNEGDNPPVYYFSIGEKPEDAVKKVASDLSSHVEETIEYRKRNGY